MERTVALVEGLVLRATSSRLPVSVRIATDGPGRVGVKVEVNALTLQLPQILAVAQTVGLFSDDYLELMSLGQPIRHGKAGELGSLPDDQPYDALHFVLTREAPVNQQKFINHLRGTTCLGLPTPLSAIAGGDKVHLYFGASQQRNALLAPDKRQVSSFDGSPCLVDYRDERLVEFVFLDATGRLRRREVDVSRYLSSERQQQADRFAWTPRVGATIYGLFKPGQMDVEAPFAELPVLRNLINTRFDLALRNHQQQQVARIEQRLQEAARRRKIVYKGKVVGFEPTNEVETILILDRLASMGALPGGMKLKIVDHSARDIDSVCEFAPDASQPSMLVPVEFEYALANFFAHGHDIRQTKVVACFTQGELVFPYRYAGQVFELVGAPGRRRLRSAEDGSEIHCLIVSDLVEYA